MERDAELKDVFNEIINKNFCNMGKKKGIQIQGKQRILSRLYQKQSSPWDIIIKLFLVECKEMILKLHMKNVRYPPEEHG